MFLVFLFIAISFAYFFLLMNYSSGWKNMPETKLSDTSSTLFLSVIVPFRNEEKNLAPLIQQLFTQTHTNFELILVNDHSTDHSIQVLETCLSQLKNVQLIQAQGFGKKNALKEGIAIAKGELIVCTDADCVPTQNWLQSIAQYQEKENCDLLCCPVKMAYQSTFFSKLQTLEFTSLIATGAASAAVNRPILCNGANLAFTLKTWQKSVVDLNEGEASGDDMFLLISVKKRKEKIRFLKSTHAMVQTASCKTFSDFYNQRKRWTSKSKSYTDSEIILVALLVFSVCAAFIVCLFAGFFNPLFWKAALFIICLKTLADISLLMPSAKFFSIEKLLMYIPFLEIIYPFYVVIVAIGGLFGKFKWK